MQAPAPPDPYPNARDSSVSPDEIARFGALAERWWDTNGPMRPLHRMNRLRTRWIDRHLARVPVQTARRLRLLDLGCGAGLASEALAALGHDVLGVDASAEAIAAAQAHARQGTQAFAGGLAYRCASAEILVSENEQFDAVIALEIIEHVTDPAAFVALLARLLRPGGVIVISTINRTWRSLATAKVGAEYVLRMLPVGTHEWRKFVTPAELSRHAGAAGLRVADIAGMVPGAGGWRESLDTGVNYIALLRTE